MKLTRRGPAAAEVPVADGTRDDTDSSVDVAGRKGRPTPKRRDAEGRRGPVAAPRTRKEALARQRQLAREEKTARRTSRAGGTAGATAATGRSSARAGSLAEQRAALRRGDESALPRRDKGPTRRLARNYVDSHRLFSNYLLLLFPLMIAASFIKTLGILQIVIILVFLALLVEWYIVGRRIRAMAIERFGSAEGGAMGIGFYAGSRAYLPRKWRMPAPQVNRGDEI